MSQASGDRGQQLREAREAITQAQRAVFAIGLNRRRYHPWINLWMMMSGAWYSLSRSRNGLLDHAFTQEDLEALYGRCDKFLTTEPPLALRQDIWSLGHFLMSAEHQIANMTDRTPALFLYPVRWEIKIPEECGPGKKKYGIPLAKRYDTLGTMSLCVMNNCTGGWQPQAGILFKSLDKDHWTTSRPTTPLIKVWKRVNSLKHKDKVFSSGVTKVPMVERWDDAIRDPGAGNGHGGCCEGR